MPRAIAPHATAVPVWRAGPPLPPAACRCAHGRDGRDHPDDPDGQRVRSLAKNRAGGRAAQCGVGQRRVCAGPMEGRRRDAADCLLW